MSLLTPIFLWLLPFIAIPIIIHLLNRRKLITHDFSTLKFFKIIDKESIQKLRLIQIILIIIRTIIILLIIIMILRPVIKGVFNRTDLNQSTLHAIIFDNTFSNYGDKKKIEATIVSILEQIPEKGKLLWINAIEGIQYAGLKDNFSIVNLPINFSYNTMRLSESLTLVESYQEEQYSSKEIYIITDKEEKTISDLWDYSNKIKEMNIYTIICNEMKDNLAITNAEIKNKTIIPNHSFEIDINIKNNGISDITDILLQLIINDMSVGHQLISLLTQQEKTFHFKTVLTSPGTHQAKIEIGADDKIEDNRYFLNIYIPDKRKIALIANSRKEFYYIEKALKALNKNNESFTFSFYNSLIESVFNLNQFDLVFITSNSLSNLAKDSKLEEYLYNKGHLIILPTINSLDIKESNLNILSPLLGSDFRNLALIEIPNQSFQSLDLASISVNQLNTLFLSNSEKDRNIRLFKYLTLPYNPSYTILQSNDGSAIWNRYSIHNGIIDVLGLDLSLQWTNFPLKGTFLPYIHFLIYSKVNKENINLTVDDNIYLNQMEYSRDMLFHILPNGTRKMLTNNDNVFMTDILEYPGHHSITLGNEVLLRTAVNINEDELLSNNLSFQDINNSKPDNVHVINIDDDIAENIKKTKIGIEIWRYILYLLLILIIIEMLISNDIKKN